MAPEDAEEAALVAALVADIGDAAKLADAPGAPDSGAAPVVDDAPHAPPPTVAEVLYPSASANLSGPAFLAAQADKAKAAEGMHAVDLPVLDGFSDGVRWAEPGAVNVTDYGNVMSPPPGQTFTEPAEVALAKLAMLHAGVGITLAGKFFGMFLESAKGNPAKLTEAKAMETLQGRFGDKTAATIEDARGFVRQLGAKWPGVTRFLNESGLGNDPRMIALLAQASRRKKR